MYKAIFVFLGLNCCLGYDNLSLQRPTYQTLIRNCEKNQCIADNAVDGNITTCASTKVISPSGPDHKVRWHVDLGKELSIYSIRIQFKDFKESGNYTQRQRGRFAGFSLYVSNSTKMDDNFLCYKNISHIPPLDFTIPCLKQGRYIIYYNERLPGTNYTEGYETSSYTHLCEVTVKGCKRQGFYGINCSIPCPANCLGKGCNISDGSCFGCMPGWRGTFCNQTCEIGLYGQECSSKCSWNCKNNNTCNHVDGNCTNGCMEGWKGKNCDQGCTKGKFGENCAMNCSGNCLYNETCDRFTGRCKSGCIPGYTGILCSKECPSETFGKDCAHQCSRHCFNNQRCNHVNGTCENGCAKGYQGWSCNSTCSDGYFGANCSEMCSTNCSTSCNHVDGLCICLPGTLNPPKCNEECGSGFYGINCSNKCSSNCKFKDTCYKQNGSCPRGCQDPFYGDKCTEHNGTGTAPLERSQVFINDEDNVTVGVAVGTSISIFIIVVISAFLFIRFRINARKKSPLNEKTKTTTALHMQTFENNGFDASQLETRNSTNDRRGGFTHFNKRISIKDLKETIAKMSKDEDAGFENEYIDIAKGELHPCLEAKKPENAHKNRYKNLFPYDHSRVVLQSPHESSYINANFIEDFQGRKSYIATQGPKPKTINDFWYMVCQEDVRVIVCLTDMKEGTKTKCAQYWPEKNHEKKYGDLKIGTENEVAHSNYITRYIHIQKYGDKKELDVIMFHYTNWPDHGVPDPLSLVLFHRHVLRMSKIYWGKYTLVHCSAGIGRTGTYIALDALYREALKTGKVNVPKYVEIMRKDRMNMIQGEKQYKVVYLALFETFREKSKCQSKEQFLQEYQEQTSNTNREKYPTETTLSAEFEELNNLKERYSMSDYTIWSLNTTANYTKTVFPVDKYLCHLTYEKDRGTYYNAVIHQSFTCNDKLISAQYPLPDYVEDFLRLVKDFNVNIAVFMCPLTELSSSSQWFPFQKEAKRVGSFTINYNESRSKKNITITDILILKEETCKMDLAVIECKKWRDGTSSSDPEVLLDAINVTKNEDIQPDTKILVLSSDGVKGCGQFCVAYNALDQISLDREVDVFTSTRLLQIRRPEFISTLMDPLENLLPKEVFIDFPKDFRMSHQYYSFTQLLCPELLNMNLTGVKYVQLQIFFLFNISRISSKK